MLNELSALLDLLKAKGVTHYEGMCMLNGTQRHVVTLDLAPTVAALPEEEAAKPQDMCRCGHKLEEHQGGLCMHACDEEKCS